MLIENESQEKNRKIFILNPISMEIWKIQFAGKLPSCLPCHMEQGKERLGNVWENKKKLSVLCEITLAGEIVILGTYSTLDFGNTSQWRLQVRSWIWEFTEEIPRIHIHYIISSKNSM